MHIFNIFIITYLTGKAVQSNNCRNSGFGTKDVDVEAEVEVDDVCSFGKTRCHLSFCNALVHSCIERFPSIVV